MIVCFEVPRRAAVAAVARIRRPIRRIRRAIVHKPAVAATSIVCVSIGGAGLAAIIGRLPPGSQHHYSPPSPYSYGSDYPPPITGIEVVPDQHPVSVDVPPLIGVFILAIGMLITIALKRRGSS